MKRRTALAAVVFVPAVPVLAQTSLTTIHVSSSPDEDIVPILYGQSAGIYRDAGLDVVFQKANSGSAVTAAVAGGAIDVGKSSMVPIINAHARGIPFVLVGPSGLYQASAPDGAMLVAADSPVHTAHDLDGKIVSVAGLFDLNWIGAQAWIDASGGDSKAVKFVEIPNSAVLPAILQGRIAAGTVVEPFLIQGVRSGARKLCDHLDAIAPRFLEAAWFATADYCAKNRTVVARFAQALAQASAYANTHPAEVVALIAAFTGIDAGTLSQIHRTLFATSLDPLDIQPLVAVTAKYNVIPHSFDARDLLLR